MSFYNKLVNIGKNDILHEIEYKTPKFYNLEKVLRRIERAKKENIVIITDPDVDGVLAAVAANVSLNILGYENVTICKYTSRSHLISEYGIEMAINDLVDLVIIIDTGTNELEKINKLTNYGIDVIILDHHQTQLEYSDYSNGVYVINPSIENRTNDIYRLSAGGVVFCVFNELLCRNGINTDILATYALATLYSDSMDMGNYLNRSIYFKAIRNTYFPPQFQSFTTEHTILSRRFLSFRFINKLNAVFRAERFDLINRYMGSGKLSVDDLAEFDKVHEESREMVNVLYDRAKIEKVGDMLYCDISEIKSCLFNNYNLANYTGLLANRISKEELSPAVVVYRTDNNNYKGSFRDTQSRPFLGVFKEFSNSNGHDAAFGISIDNIELFKEGLRKVKFNFTYFNSPIILDADSLTEEDIDDMAIFNEFATTTISPALIEIDTSELCETYDRYYKAYKWRGFKIKAEMDIRHFDKVIVKPEHSNTVQMYQYVI